MWNIYRNPCRWSQTRRSKKLELKQGVGDSEPILSIDLNALNLSTDLQMLQVNQKGIGEIEGIKFKDSPRMLKFQTE